MNLNAREAQLDLFSQSALNISGKMDTTRATMSFDSVIRGYHIYKDLPWVPVIGETFSCEREPFNIHDPYAVAIKDLEVVVLRRGGIITCEVTAARKYSSDLPQGGLEVPCRFIFKSCSVEISKLRKLLSQAPSSGG